MVEMGCGGGGIGRGWLGVRSVVNVDWYLGVGWVGPLLSAIPSAGGGRVHALLVDFRVGEELLCTGGGYEVIVAAIGEVDVVLCRGVCVEVKSVPCLQGIVAGR